MFYRNNHPSDKANISTTVQKNECDWEVVCDQNASTMFGAIFNMTGDEKLSGEILQEAFREIKCGKMFTPDQTSVTQKLLQFTYTLTMTFLKNRGLLPLKKQPFQGDYPLINLFYFELASIEDTASDAEITKQDVRKMLREEFNALRNQPQKSNSITELTKQIW
jgi:hypothetical protein